ncbi:PQQ-binding-like beta-propeller repeat protein [Streptomyces orinoci]|uniref:PQQ-binding-like beta-propeller repeat protein n=1 Tax=Streptomyces orinoci TaxID=67339 RepID=A0ABV3K7V2_STRON
MPNQSVPGAPTPGAPAYGYPQMPPAPPAAPAAGGYGYPGPGQPPQFGGPFAPQAPYPAAPAAPAVPSQGGSKQRLVVIISAVIAVLLVAGGGVWFFTKDGGKSESSAGSSGGSGGGGGSTDKPAPRPQSADGKLVFGVEQPKVPDSRDAPGMWITDQVFAKTDLFKVVGYGVTGGQKWEIPLDGEICSASRHVTDDGKTAILVQDKKPTNEKFSGGRCNEVVAIDLNNGKKLWQKQSQQGDQTITFDQVTVGANIVAAGGIAGGSAWSMDGKELWKPKPQDDCHDDGYGGGSKLVAVRRCGDYEHPQMSVQTLKPDGAVASSFKLPNGISDAYVASVDPLVIGVNANDHTGSGVSDFMVVDDSAKDGKLRSKISTENGKYVPRCRDGVDGCRKVVVSKDTLYLPTNDHQTGKAGDVGQTNEVVGFDLSNGQAKGKADGRLSSSMSPVTVDKDGGVIAYQTSSWRYGGQVVRIDPKTFKVDVLLKNPKDSYDTENQILPDYDWVIWTQNRLYLGRTFIHQPDQFAKGKEYLAEVWGAN